MRPLDPRLLRHASRARAAIGGLAALGAVTAGLTIVQAWLLATVIAQVFVDKATLTAAPLIALAAVTAGRAVTAWAAQALAHRASAVAKAQLRGALLARVIALGPAWRRGADAGADAGARDAASLTQLATAGLDGLDGYFTSYLPALILAVVVPLAVLTTVGAADPLSGAVVALTLPLVPLFGAFIGMAAARHARQRWQALASLAHHFQDVVGGLPTLRVFGRTDAQRTQIARVTADYRRATMTTLRLAFASSLALELIATMSVALVATEIGLRLAGGHLALRSGLLVLILAPEAYLPLRALGTQFHATADGLAAAGQVFAVLETPRPVPAAQPAPAADGGPAQPRAAAVIRLDNVTVSHEGRAEPGPAGVTATVLPGRLTAVTGPSGCGKSTLLSCLLGFTEPTSGTISPRPGHGVRPGAERPPAIASPGIPNDGGVLVIPAPSSERGPDGPPPGLAEAAAAGPDPVQRHGGGQHPARLARRAGRSGGRGGQGRRPRRGCDLALVLGEHGTGLSTGQRRRVALARALLPGPPLLLLDEPTAGLDAEREAVVTQTLRRYAAAGHTVLAVSHRPALVAAADEVIDLTAPAGRRRRDDAATRTEVPA